MTCQFSQPGDLDNTDPKLRPLQDNGGFTATHALLPGSPAIDAGNNTGCPTTDQRGVGRPQGAACDIGAYELETAKASIPTLSEWAQFGMALILVGVAAWSLRRRRPLRTA